MANSKLITDLLKSNPKKEFSIPEIRNEVNLSYGAILRHLRKLKVEKILEFRRKSLSKERKKKGVKFYCRIILENKNEKVV